MFINVNIYFPSSVLFTKGTFWELFPLKTFMVPFSLDAQSYHIQGKSVFNHIILYFAI